ncbi:DUF1036 domain-containing protein [Mameliella sp. CS4]|uniref:DUF1036 domain-containing protein n=2 Tax=Mameliella TaxID=1434019 RepID=UPI001C5D9CDA|nr:DUF1036 domain-containing protein [Mameliella sp. CS4]MBW4981631.1 DUF1036 domain-containing protein [Mameliella sp. CS4]
MHRLFLLALCLMTAFNAGESRAQTQYAQNNNQFTVIFLNACNRQIQTAINYRDLSGNWVTNGWWNLSPGESATVAFTTNRIYYMYAESIAPVSSRIYWRGAVRHFHIRGSSNTYGFRQRTMDMNNWGRWTERFTCN